MQRLLPFILWIALNSSPLSGYSADVNSSDASTGRIFQTNEVRGKVTDEAGVGMPGVNIIVKGTSNGTTTDADGNYVLSLSPQERSGLLVFSFIGYAVQEVPINNRSSIDIALVADTQELTEVVVVGYGVQEKRDVTAAITSISADDITKIPSTNTLDGMKGQLAGVDVMQAGGRPGEYPAITIRGRRSINASNDPLFVIDGVPMTAGTGTIYDFNPADIESIEVLKDAAATAIYGSRGANGVILVTTKRGKAGKTVISYNGYYGVSQAINVFPMMNGQQFADFKREANRIDPNGKTGRTAWQGTIPSDDIVFIDPVEYQSATEGRSTDWLDLIIQNGSQMDHQVSARGGNDKTQFNMSVGYFKDDGIIEGMDFTKYTARVNLDHQISPRVKAGMSTLFSHSVQNWGSGSVLSEAVNQTPLGMPYDDQGNLIFLPISDGIRSNPLNELVEGKRIDERKFDRVFASLYAELEIIKGLKYKFLFGPDLRYRTQGIFEGQFTNTRKNGTPAAQFSTERNMGYTMENLITYDRTINESHRLGITLLQSLQGNTFERSHISVADLPYESQKWYNVGSAPTLVAKNSNFSEWSLSSWMGRINYTINDRYMLQATMRADGSSRLAPKNQWTTFPGLSAGWRISEESFMSDIKAISELKIRASYGVVGNTSVDPYQTKGRLSGSVYSWDEKSALGFRLNEIPNEELTWEKSATIDAGLDFGFFQGRLHGSIDVYQTQTTDLLLRRLLPRSSGYDFVLSNIGATETKGIELTLGANIFNTPSGFTWDVDFNLSRYKEAIVDLALRDAEGNISDDPGNAWFIGQPIRVFYDYKKIGIWQADEFDEAQAMDKAYPGEIKVADINGDGTISPTGDRTILGTDIPSALGGLNNRFAFKGFDLSIFVYYRLGFMIDSRFHQDQATMQARYNNLVVDYWTIDNPTNEYPRPNKNQEFPQRRETLRYKEAGFAKLRNITLGYNFPSAISQKIGLSNLRIYVTAQNPIIWSKYDVFDPETVNEINTNDVPSTKLFLGGVNLSF